jgi:predicted TIM-barrel fold metal-dependent hydrolase
LDVKTLAREYDAPSQVQAMDMEGLDLAAPLRRPSDYFLKQCFISVDPDEYLVADVIRRIGDDNIVISTDYPHIDAHFPHALDEFFEIHDLSDGSRREILWDNCARLYNLA